MLVVKSFLYIGKVEKLYTHILDTPIFEEDHLRPITTVKDLIVDPDSGKVLAIVVNLSKNLVITPNDMSSWGDVITVSSPDVIIDGAEIVRVDQVLKDGVKIFGNKVVTKKGEELGRVFDFAIDGSTLGLRKIFVAKGFLGLFRYAARIIPAKDIIEILADKIVVKASMQAVKEEEREAKMEEAVAG